MRLQIFFCILLLASRVLAQCEAGKYSITIKQTYASSASEESWDIYDQESSTVVRTFQGSTSSVTVTNTVCLANKEYRIDLRDTYGDGWGTSTIPSMVYTYYKGVHLDQFTMPFKSGTTYKTDTTSFHPRLLFFNGDWKYTNTPQSGSSWTSVGFNDASWSTSTDGAFPAFSAITRYYRNTFTVSPSANLRAVSINIVSDAAVVIYFDGLKVFDYKIDPSNITPTTPASSLKDGTAAARTVFIHKAHITSGSHTVAVEIHQHDTQTTNADAFDAFLTYREVEDSALSANLFVDGSVTGSTAYSSTYALTKAFDRSLSTYYYSTQPNAYLIYTFPNGKRELMNHYSIRSSTSSTYGYPSAWTVYASNNGDDWYLLDHQENQLFAAIKVKKEYTVSTNTVAFNKYKFVFEAGTIAGKTSVGEIEIAHIGIEPAMTTLSYPKSSFALIVGNDPQIYDPSTGFTNFSSEPALPDGITLNPASGRLTLDPAVPSTTTSYTITAHSLFNQVPSTFTISISVEACAPPNYTPIRLVKNNKSSANQERFTIRNAMNETIFESPVGTNNANQIFSMCVPTGVLTFELFDSSSNGWYSGNFLSIQNKAGADYITHARIGLMEKSYISYSFDMTYPIYTYSYDFKVLQGSMPTGWEQPSFIDASWSVLTETPVPSTSNVWLFRKHFNTNSLNTTHGFDLNFRYKDAFVVYLNGRELYRHNLPEGPITAATVPTRTNNDFSWFTVTGDNSYLVPSGDNVLAIAVISNDNPSTNVDFNCYLQYLMNSDITSRTFETTVTNNVSTSVLTGVTDLSINSYIQMTLNGKYELNLDFDLGNRAEYVNKYCIINGGSSETYDPNDWGIFGSDDGEIYTLLANETNVRFDSRKQTKCYYIPNLTKPYQYYRIAINEPWNAVNNYIYYITEVLFYVEDTSKMVIPPLYMTPSYVEAFVAAEFPTMIESHDVYRDYTIEPPLPEGLELDTSTGNIRGKYVGPLFNTTFTLTAKDHLNQVHTTTIQVAVVTCQDQYVLTSLFFFGTATGNEMGFRLYDKSYKTLDYRNNLLRSESIWFHYCLPIGSYILTLQDSAYNGWEGGYVKVYIDNTYMVHKGTLKNGEGYKDVPLNLGYIIKPSSYIWKYSNNDVEVPGNWHNSDSVVANWAMSKPSAMPPALGTTQYYATTINVDEELVNKFASVEISLNIRCGAIIYINGEEIRRIRMPSGDVTKNMFATSGTSIAEVVTTILSGQFGPLASGLNHLGVEVHKCSRNDDSTPFDLALRFSEGDINRLSAFDFKIIGDILNDYTYYPAKNLFDDNYSTNHLSGPRCVGATYGVVFNNEKVEYINSYHVSTYWNCNPRHPSGWQVQGSNDLQTWTTLHEVSGHYFYYKPSTEYFEFYNKNSYRAYRFVVTECNNSMIDPYMEQSMCTEHYEFSGNYDDYGFELGDFVFSTKLLANLCNREDGYSAATSGSYATKKCPEFYSGYKRRLCTNGVLGEEESLCKPSKPEHITYTTDVMIFKVGQEITPFVPQVGAVDYICDILPPLPAGLDFDIGSASITGTPTVASIASTYFVTCTNSAGTASTELILGVNDVKGLPISTYIILGVLIVICAIILAVIVTRQQMAKSRKTKLQSTASSSRRGSMTDKKPESIKKDAVNV